MTPLTKEQAEALAERLKARAELMWSEADACFRNKDFAGDKRYRHEAEIFEDLATEIRNGTFIEVTPPETGQ